ncbi:MAG: hypothetical protein EB107_13130, partial [Proteobacteria bacterium]|nr:hypothetical protein [Pseudomonadota bacterium]
PAGEGAGAPGEAPPWRNSGVRQDPSGEPDGLEHANHTARQSWGSAAVTPSMQAGMPADHDPARRPWRAPR